MTSTGTYSFNPSAADLILNAYSLIQIRRTELTVAHLEDAYMQCNLLMVDISNRNPNRWVLETQNVSIIAGTATYALDLKTIAIAIAYISVTSGGITTDRVLGPISATDYAAIPNKADQGPPTSFFFSLLTTPTITYWPTPGSASTYTGKLQTFRQLQDVDITSGTTLDSPYRFLDAITFGLAARLAEMYKPESADRLDAKYEKKFMLAASQDEENVPLFITPGLGGYYR
jgi:hypothetical protein